MGRFIVSRIRVNSKNSRVMATRLLSLVSVLGLDIVVFIITPG